MENEYPNLNPQTKLDLLVMIIEDSFNLQIICDAIKTATDRIAEISRERWHDVRKNPKYKLNNK